MKFYWMVHHSLLGTGLTSKGLVFIGSYGSGTFMGSWMELDPMAPAPLHGLDLIIEFPAGFPAQVQVWAPNCP